MKKKQILSFFSLLCLFILFFSPEVCFAGAKKGITLWIYTIIPSLLPFIIVSNLFLNLNLLLSLTDWLYPILHPLFKVSKYGCFPILIGMMSGYPMGAKACADLVKEGKISSLEGQYLLSFVNNPSPMFLTTYLSIQCLQNARIKYLLYCVLLASSFFNSFLYRILFLKRKTFNHSLKETSKDNASRSFAHAIDQAILDGFITIIKIGGYVLLFSILAMFLLNLPLTLKPLTYGLLSLTEITTACYELGISTFSTKIKLILTLTSTAFGGLSSLFQTQSVIAGSGLSLKTYIQCKITQCIFVFLSITVLLIFFRI